MIEIMLYDDKKEKDNSWEASLQGLGFVECYGATSEEAEGLLKIEIQKIVDRLNELIKTL